MDETLKIYGHWTAFNLREDITEDNPVVSLLRAIMQGKVAEDEKQKTIEDLTQKKIILGHFENHNLVPTVGRTRLARVLTTASATGLINYIALGTGTAAFSNSSTQLNSENYRKTLSDSSFDNNLAYSDVFIASGDVANQTFKEAAAFIDGTTGTNTGSAFSLVVQDFTKSGSMFISLKVTIS